MAEQPNQKNNSETPTTAPKKSQLPLMVAAAIVLVIGGGIAAFAYFSVGSQQVSIDKASVSAPSIPLAPTAADTLKAVYVSPGDVVPANTVVAEVGTELLKTTVAGLIISTNNDIGSQVPAGTPVVTMIDPTALRVVGELDENKGLTDIKVGDRATFTVDAFGGTQFTGVVDEISPTANSSAVVFNISDQRQTQTFDVKVGFDVAAHPELKNGMSARLRIFTTH